MRQHLLFITLLTVGLVNAAQAEHALAWVGTLSVGPVWNTGNGETQTLTLAPETVKTYSADKSTNSLVDAEVFIGVQKFLSDHIAWQLGGAYAMTDSALISGDIWDDGLSAFNNYDYQYEVVHRHLVIKGKLLADWKGWVAPWISASVGVGFNKAYDFTNTPSTFEAVPTANFSSGTTTSFTYAVGIGVQKKLGKQLQLGLGYEFADWGKSQLGPAAGQTSGDGLSLDHLYTNGLLFNITAVI